MARAVKYVDTCDWCAYHKLPDAPAAGRHEVAFDSELKEVDLCVQHQSLLAPFIETLRHHGRDVELRVKRQARTKRRIAAADQAALPVPPQHRVEEAPPEDRGSVVRCPLPHDDVRSDGWVQHRTRTGHAATMHRLKVWEIAWEDPQQILTAFCKVHQECMDVKLGYPTKQGLKLHIHRCPLKRID